MINDCLESSVILQNFRRYMYNNDVFVFVEQSDRFTEVRVWNAYGDKFTILQNKDYIIIVNSFIENNNEIESILKNICKADIFEFRKLMSLYRDEFCLFNYYGDLAFFENKQSMYWTYRGIKIDQIDKTIFYSQNKDYIFDRLIEKFQFISHLDDFKNICFENKIKKENVLHKYNHFRKFLNSRGDWRTSHLIKEKWLKDNLIFNADL